MDNNIIMSRIGKTDLNFHLDVFAHILRLPCARVDIHDHTLLFFDHYLENESHITASTLLHDNGNPALFENEEVKHSPSSHKS